VILDNLVQEKNFEILWRINAKTFNKLFTYRFDKNNVASLCKEPNNTLNNHNKLSDINAFGKLILRCFNRIN
jgi:hypothetical protein